MNLVKSALIGLFMVCAWAPTAQAIPCSDCEDGYFSDLQSCDSERDSCMADADRFENTWVDGAWAACSGTGAGGRDGAGPGAIACAYYIWIAGVHADMVSDCNRDWSRCESRACARKDACELDCDPFPEDSNI